MHLLAYGFGPSPLSIAIAPATMVSLVPCTVWRGDGFLGPSASRLKERRIHDHGALILRRGDAGASRDLLQCGNTDRYALCADKTGCNLPKNVQAWLLRGGHCYR